MNHRGDAYPTIGIGAGSHAMAEILVLHDRINLSFSLPSEICAPVWRCRRL